MLWRAISTMWWSVSSSFCLVQIKVSYTISSSEPHFFGSLLEIFFSNGRTYLKRPWMLSHSDEKVCVLRPKDMRPPTEGHASLDRRTCVLRPKDDNTDGGFHAPYRPSWDNHLYFYKNDRSILIRWNRCFSTCSTQWCKEGNKEKISSREHIYSLLEIIESPFIVRRGECALERLYVLA